MSIQTESKVLNNTIDMVSRFVNEGTMSFGKDGIQITAMDTANVCMVGLKIKKSALKIYKPEVENISLNFVELKNIIKRMKEDIKLKTKDNMLILETIGELKKRFNLSLLEEIQEKQEIPKLKFETVFDIDAKDIQEAIKDIECASDTATFIATKQGLKIVGEGDLIKAEIDLKTKIKTHGEKAKFNVDYLTKIMSCRKMAETVKIYLKTDYPLKIEIKGKDLDFWAILAPRVDSE